MADPFKIETLIAWLEMQPASGTYDYQDFCGACMLGQYMAAHGIAWSVANYLPFHNDRRFNAAAQAPMDKATKKSISTFGAALDRARKLLPEKKTDITVFEEILQHAPVGSRLPANVT
jgi:hypothetical protein